MARYNRMMIYGETVTEYGELVLNVRWPQRHLYWCSCSEGDAFVWADSEGDAIETLAEHYGVEDDDTVSCRGTDAKEYAAVKKATDLTLTNPTE